VQLMLYENTALRMEGIIIVSQSTSVCNMQLALLQMKEGR
jgi:hypothetical protein